MQEASHIDEQALLTASAIKSPQAMSTDDVLSQWAAEHCPDADLELQSRQISARMPSWIAPRSVHAGVVDIMCTAPANITNAAMTQLADALCRRMVDDNLFGMIQPRRSGLLG